VALEVVGWGFPKSDWGAVLPSQPSSDNRAWERAANRAAWSAKRYSNSGTGQCASESTVHRVSEPLLLTFYVLPSLRSLELLEGHHATIVKDNVVPFLFSFVWVILHFVLSVVWPLNLITSFEAGSFNLFGATPPACPWRFIASCPLKIGPIR
jgi:hypothetical protein